VISTPGKLGGITLTISLTEALKSSVPALSIVKTADNQWDKCFDGYWAFKEDLNRHKQEWRHVKQDWKMARETLKQKLRSSRDLTRAFNRI
jgi:hypothetical protein